MRVISFKIWGDYAHFRRHYTTSSPLTHSVPPPSALRGIIGAILGLKRHEYPEVLNADVAKFGIKLLNPVKKLRLGMNFMDTKDGSWVDLDTKKLRPVIKKDGHGNPRLHTQVRMEFLKEPAYEIFFHHSDDQLMDKLSRMLRNHTTVFTPYLGISECLANFEFLWDRDVRNKEGIAEVVTVVRLQSLVELKLKEGTGIVKERIPIYIDAFRLRLIGDEVVFNPYAGPILALVQDVYQYPESKEVFTFIG